MKTKTAKDYVVDGHMDAEKRVQRDDLRPGSWQHTAYWKGRNGYAADQLAKARWEEEQQSAPDAIRLHCMPGNTKGWPIAAAEHARLLARDLNAEGAGPRRDRLQRALCRLQVRHQPQRPLPQRAKKAIIVRDVMISTQPHPDGAAFAAAGRHLLHTTTGRITRSEPEMQYLPKKRHPMTEKIIKALKDKTA